MGGVGRAFGGSISLRNVTREARRCADWPAPLDYFSRCMVGPRGEGKGIVGTSVMAEISPRPRKVREASPPSSRHTSFRIGAPVFENLFEGKSQRGAPPVESSRRGSLLLGPLNSTGFPRGETFRAQERSRTSESAERALCLAHVCGATSRRRRRVRNRFVK